MNLNEGRIFTGKIFSKQNIWDRNQIFCYLYLKLLIKKWNVFIFSKLILQFDVLKRSYQEIDPYYTNFVLRDEFEETLRELCPELNRQEMEYICSKHECPSDIRYWNLIDFFRSLSLLLKKYYNTKKSKINYAEFLEPYAPKRNREKPEDSLKEEQEGDMPSSRLDMNDTLVLKLRIKVTLFILFQIKTHRKLFIFVLYCFKVGR